MARKTTVTRRKAGATRSSDGEWTNAKRVKRAKKYLAEWYETEPSLVDDTEVIDALADLRHLCDAKRLDFAKLDRTAYGHYTEERRCKACGHTPAFCTCQRTED